MQDEETSAIELGESQDDNGGSFLVAESGRDDESLIIGKHKLLLLDILVVRKNVNSYTR